MFRDFSQKSDLLERHTPVLPYTASTPPPPPTPGHILVKKDAEKGCVFRGGRKTGCQNNYTIRVLMCDYTGKGIQVNPNQTGGGGRIHPLDVSRDNFADFIFARTALSRLFFFRVLRNF